MGQPDRDFTLRQLRTFICAARAGSFSHAAAELGISQPAVSDQIALLEDRLLRNVRVLMVDGSEIVRSFVEQSAMHHGMRTRVGGCGAHALA